MAMFALLVQKPKIDAEFSQNIHKSVAIYRKISYYSSGGKKIYERVVL
ncbi:hypothetical protein CLL_A1968 [Clostridium botulinum B str. Eklund 17B (NRP)]|uniref:Uncharacterized protein n=1 Tax=Clostridium botulinum (strain Eklund 17B / Type B) TaxID=935198 RepID=B2TM44_CLOBB|nr:hypothetical protein [Clostridium sp. ZBS13]ACD22597.1 hypothetical protein CLL_A1968 [Clostridium botulinum B str. Eklund 17B (NRP)]